MSRYPTLLITACAWILMSFKGDEVEHVNQRVMGLIRDQGFNHSKVLETLFQLTDVNGPRLTGSPGMKNAETWAVKRMEEFGIHAYSEPWGGFGKGWEIKKSYLAMTESYYQQLIAVPRAWTPGTNGSVKAEATLVRLRKYEDFAQYSGSLKGKIVVMAPEKDENKPNFTADASRNTKEDLEKLAMDPRIDDNATNLSQVAPEPAPKVRPGVMFRKQIDSFLVAEGALAALSGGRGTMGTVFTSNGASRAWDAPPVVPEMEMGSEHLNRLVRLLESGHKVELEMDTKTEFHMDDSIENNVIAEIPGTDPELKSQFVMLGAHMDSWHAGTGATDNGAGTAVVIEAMRILKAIGIHPRRTIRACLWSGEEQGLLGSRGYVKKHIGDRLTMHLKPAQAKISAYFNLDNGDGRIRGVFMQDNAQLRPIFEAWLAPFADLGASTLTIRNTGSTDHISFDEVGIPGFQFIQDGLEYGSRDHHSNMDLFDRASAPDLEQASIIMAAFVYDAAMRDDMLPRKPLPQVNKGAASWQR